MERCERVPARVGFWAVLLLGVFAWAPALYPGYWQGWEGFAPVFQSVTPTALASVATTPDLWRGAGSGAFLLAQPLLRLGAAPTSAMQIVFVLSFILGGSAVYVWLADRFGDLGAGLAGLGYMLLPLVLATVYERGSLSNALILALTPLALAGLTSYRDRRSLSGAAVAALSILWMWRIQAGLAGGVTVMLLLYALIVERRWLVALIVAASGAAGIASLIPLWTVAAPPATSFASQFIHLNTLLDVGNEVGGRTSTALSLHPHQIGFAALAGGVLSAWGMALPRNQLSPHLRRLLWFCLGAAVVAVLLSLRVSEPLWQLTRADRLFTYPWQMLLVVAPLLVAPLAALPIIFAELETPVYWAVMMALVVLASLAHLTPAYTQVRPPLRPVAILGDNQVIVLGAQLTEQEAPRTATLEVTWQPLQPLEVDYNIFFQALAASDRAPAQVVAQLDAQPLGEARPATSWQPGEVLTSTYVLDLSAAPLETPLTYYFGYYDWRDGSRLPVNGGRDDKLVLHGQ
jgi:uncharacterized membrane protein